MKESFFKRIDIRKWPLWILGIIVWTPTWLTIWGIVEQRFFSDEITIPYWLRLTITLLGIIIPFTILFFYPKILPKGCKAKHKIFILIFPENTSDDKYITDDFVRQFRRYINSFDSFDLVVPSLPKRQEFNRMLARKEKHGRDYWKSNAWKRRHKRLNGTLYISGTLSIRMSKQKEHFLFTLSSATIGYNNLNSDLASPFLKELKTAYPHQVLLNKECEYEQISAFSSRMAAVSEYLIGWAHLIGGNVESAYQMHRDIIINNKQSFKKNGIFSNINQVLLFETEIILRDCKNYHCELVDICLKQALTSFPTNSNILLLASRCIVMTSTKDSFVQNVTTALGWSQKIKINKDNRASVYANRAYLHMLLKQYSIAETEYAQFFRYFDRKVAESIIEYCDLQISTGTDLEKPVAYYVKALILYHLDPNSPKYFQSFSDAESHIPTSEVYLRNGLEKLNIESGK